MRARAGIDCQNMYLIGFYCDSDGLKIEGYFSAQRFTGWKKDFPVLFIIMVG